MCSCDTYNCSEKCICVEIPNADTCIHPEDIVKLGRFSHEKWIVKYGWYTWGGNRPVIGWYLTGFDDTYRLKPLQKTDIDDIYIIER